MEGGGTVLAAYKGPAQRAYEAPTRVDVAGDFAGPVKRCEAYMSQIDYNEEIS